jgi:hypothetical protein
VNRITLGIIGSAVLLVGAVTAQETTNAPPLNDYSRLRTSGLSRLELDRIIRGFEIAPVPLDLYKKDLALVGLGSYLVNVTGGCNDCHTNPSFAPGGDPFAGQPKQVNTENYLAGGNVFGPFVSRNLTPRAGNGLPANLTYRQFRTTMRTGQDLKNRHPQISPLLQVMPWPVYQDLTERDLRAMYEYLTAIPTASPAPEQAPEQAPEP